ncbi:MAG TPA: cytochrome c biogenesis protein CcsA [Chloroflexota bacterium]|nr:cytochrome c biogenesis protein CcsA [Chloroflexota bacterium]
MLTSAGARRALVWIAAIASAVSAAMIVFYVPNDRVQGVVQRIFYFHLALAWVAYLAFFLVLVASVVYLVSRDLRWDAFARASAELGVLFTTLVLIVGSLWGKPIWNTWWTWDPRLTTTLVLWFIYVAYLMLRAYTPDVERGARFGAILGIVGFVDVPIVHFSVQWWRSLHPDPVFARSDPQLPTPMIVTLLVTIAAMTLVFCALLTYRTMLERMRDDNRALEDDEVGERVYA